MADVVRLWRPWRFMPCATDMLLLVDGELRRVDSQPEIGYGGSRIEHLWAEMKFQPIDLQWSIWTWSM